MAFLGGSDSKESECNAEDPVSIPGLGRSPGEGNGYPLQYSCLENPKDGGAWQATVIGFQRVGYDIHYITLYIHTYTYLCFTSLVFCFQTWVFLPFYLKFILLKYS